MSAIIERLKQQITEAFRDARKPATHDEIANDWEVPQARELVGKDWSEVPFELIYQFRWDLEWFRAAGIRHYLPALLVAAFRESEVAENVIKYLSMWASEREALWPEEKRAVQAWMRYFRDERHDEDAAEALAKYWDDPNITPLDEERVRLFRRARDVFAEDRTAPDIVELAAKLQRGLEQDSYSDYRSTLSIRRPGDQERERLAALSRSLTAEQVALILDIVEYLHCRNPWREEDEPTLRFWRARAAEHAG
jgi:hypothetical protein